ncbi:MAG: hypothetical protein NC411_05510 [Bacteroides sp.]|nr:hypothetical protein [Bacteroides sp.]
MNKNILNAFIVGSIAMGLASCSENAWNDHYLKGFEGGVVYDDAVTGTYTFTDADYSTVAKLMQEEATTDAETAAAKAIGKNLYFEKYGIYPAQMAVPFFMDVQTFPYYYAPVGSTVDVTYNEVATVPDELAALTAAKTYTVSASDYATAWGSETAFIRAYAPDASVSANLSKAIAAAFADQTIEDGTYAVVTYNVASENPMFGFPDEVPPAADLYTDSEFKAGKYVLYADGIVAEILDPTLADGKYAYFKKTDVTLSGNTISGFDLEKNIFVFTETATPGQFYMGDQFGHYYYGAERYNNFYISSTAGTTDDYKWTVTKNDDGTWSIMNVLAQKCVEYSAGYSTWGEYNDARGTKPVLYVPAEAAEPAEIPLYTPTSVTNNAVYVYNGSSWAVADGVVALNPSDYTDMGFSNNKLSEPEVYLPLYLRHKFPYAQSGDQKFVVYNGTKADLCLFDGSTWTVNNNGLETVTGRYERKKDGWVFVKYIGKAIYSPFNEAQIELDRSYLIVSGDICGVPISKSSSYGYIQQADITYTDDQIIQSSDVNAFRFASSYVDEDGNETKAPEGKFMIVDSNNRYVYMYGTYNSVNVSDAPTINDGVISDGYLWTATPAENGLWSIVNMYNNKTMAYSPNYSSFGVYETISEPNVRPSLYILNE